MIVLGEGEEAMRELLPALASRGAHRLHDVFDRQGHWNEGSLPGWIVPVEQRLLGRSVVSLSGA